MKIPFRLAALCATLTCVTAVQGASTYEFRQAHKGLTVLAPSSNTGSGSQNNQTPTPPPAPALTYQAGLSTTSLSFEDTSLGGSRTKQVLFMNTGTGALSVTSPVVTGSDFSATSSCSGTLAAGASCQADITFTPSAQGTRSGSVSFGSNATGGALTLSLSGRGLQADGVLSADTNTAFGTVAQGNSVSRTFHFTNAGNVPLSGVYAALTGAGTTLTSNTCGTSITPITLAAGADCSMVVTYAPSAAGVLAGSLSVVSSALDSPDSLSLSGTAVVTYLASLSTSSLTFSDTQVGSTQTKSVMLMNDGSGTLTVGTPTVTGSGFSATTNCQSTLAPNASCAVDVVFQPTVKGTASATLNVPTNATNGSTQVSLSGVGLQASSSLTAQTNTAFGNVVVNTTATRSFTFTNTGNVALTGVNAAVTGTGLTLSSNTCGTSASPVTVAAGATCSVTVQYAPTTTGTLSSAQLTVASSSPTSPDTQNLTGAAVWPTAALDLNFSQGTTNLANSAALTAVGSVTASTTYGYASGFSDTAYYAGTTSTADTSISSSTDFTLEGWFYLPSAVSTYNTVIRGDNAGSLDAGFLIGGFKYQVQPGNYTRQFNFTAPTSQWFHMAVVRQGGQASLYLNGVKQGSSVADTNAFSSSAFRIGSNPVAGYSLRGYLGSLKLTKSALYTGTFTPAGSPAQLGTGMTIVKAYYGALTTDRNNLTTKLGTVCNTFGVCSFNPLTVNGGVDPASGSSKWMAAKYTCGSPSGTGRMYGTPPAEGTTQVINCSTLNSYNGTITVTTASYGANRGGTGNMTTALKAACDGTKVCEFSAMDIYGADPYANQTKDIQVSYTCSNGGGTKTFSVAAGNGDTARSTISCP